MAVQGLIIVLVIHQLTKRHYCSLSLPSSIGLPKVSTILAFNPIRQVFIIPDPRNQEGAQSPGPSIFCCCPQVDANTFPIISSNVWEKKCQFSLSTS